MTHDYKAASERSDEAERGLTSAVPRTPRTHITFIRRDGTPTHAEILTGGHPLTSDKLANLVRFLARHEERKFTYHHDEALLKGTYDETNK